MLRSEAAKHLSFQGTAALAFQSEILAEFILSPPLAERRAQNDRYTSLLLPLHRDLNRATTRQAPLNHSEVVRGDYTCVEVALSMNRGPAPGPAPAGPTLSF
jgi:hypothetical protein